MTGPKRLLILGGTAEAAELARLADAALTGRAEVVSSLAGRTEPPPELAGRVRVGPFGGVAGLVAYLEEAGIDWLIDASHPFADTISAHAHAAALAAGVPRLMLVRPPWRMPPGLRWVEVDDMATAAEVLPRFSRRALLSVGAGGVGAFSEVEGVWLLVRLLAPPEDSLALADYEVVVGRPPFAVEDERALFAEHRIDTIVSRHSGGASGEAKIIAAREAGVRVLLIARPPPEPGEAVATAEQALAWVEGQA